ncbi:MAG: hypothetical protein ACJ0DI_03085 [bacterium]
MISPLFLMALLTGAFGMIQAASGIAMTSETLSLITSENKSLSTGLWMTLYTVGTGLSGTLFSQLLKLGVFSNEWSWMGNPMSVYDGLLLICGGMILLLTVTLGLIPSMISTQGGMDSTGLLKKWSFRRPQRPSLDHGNDGWRKMKTQVV